MRNTKKKERRKKTSRNKSMLCHVKRRKSNQKNGNPALLLVCGAGSVKIKTKKVLAKFKELCWIEDESGSRKILNLVWRETSGTSLP